MRAAFFAEAPEEGHAGPTLAQLSRRFGVSYSTLRRRAAAERWAEERRRSRLSAEAAQAAARLDGEKQRAAAAAKKFLGLLWKESHRGATASELARTARALSLRAAAAWSEASRLEWLGAQLREPERDQHAVEALPHGGSR